MFGAAGICSLLLSDWRRSLTELQSQACDVLWPRPSMLPLTQSSPVKEEEFCWEMSVQERRSVCLCLRSESETPVARSTGVSQCPVTVRSPLEYNIRPPHRYQHTENGEISPNILKEKTGVLVLMLSLTMTTVVPELTRMSGQTLSHLQGHNTFTIHSIIQLIALLSTYLCTETCSALEETCDCTIMSPP